MRKPIALLDDDKPLDVIASGDYRACRGSWPGSRARAHLARWTSTHRRVGHLVPTRPGRRRRPLRPADPADNRWQRGAIVEALYFGDSEATVWAEWYRFLAEAGLPPSQGLPRDLWRWEISLPEVADLADDGRLARSACRHRSPTARSGRRSSRSASSCTPTAGRRWWRPRRPGRGADPVRVPQHPRDSRHPTRATAIHGHGPAHRPDRDAHVSSRRTGDEDVAFTGRSGTALTPHDARHPTSPAARRPSPNPRSHRVAPPT